MIWLRNTINKRNMKKKFDLEKAKAGAEVCDGFGRMVRLVDFDYKGFFADDKPRFKDTPIVAIVDVGDDEEYISHYNNLGFRNSEDNIYTNLYMYDGNDIDFAEEDIPVANMGSLQVKLCCLNCRHCRYTDMECLCTFTNKSKGLYIRPDKNICKHFEPK